MIRSISFSAALLVGGAIAPLASPCAAAGRIVITEVMYNPASDEDRGQSEWVEIANIGDAPVVLASWRLDDEDKLPMDDWGSFSCTLAPGAVAVLVNGSFVDEAQFRAAWDPVEAAAAVGSPSTSSGTPSGANPASTPASTPAPAPVPAPGPTYLVIPVKWGGISNSPGDGNEVLRLLDADNHAICSVALGNGGSWPKLSHAGGPSVYLASPPPAPATTAVGGTPPTIELNDGAAWKASSIGDAGARECRRTAIFNGRDIASPGRLPAALLPATTAVGTAATGATAEAPRPPNPAPGSSADPAAGNGTGSKPGSSPGSGSASGSSSGSSPGSTANAGFAAEPDSAALRSFPPLATRRSPRTIGMVDEVDESGSAVVHVAACHTDSSRPPCVRPLAQSGIPGRDWAASDTSVDWDSDHRESHAPRT
ncbi:MAG: lamin tail domain-containing protein [Phycisphaerales bacterium]